MSDRDEFTRDVMERAIRRLNILEYVILGLAALLALLGGALVAWLLGEMVEIPFRLGWALASLFLFLVPGAIVYARENLRSTPGRRAVDDVEQSRDAQQNRGETQDGR